MRHKIGTYSFLEVLHYLASSYFSFWWGFRQAFFSNCPFGGSLRVAAAAQSPRAVD